MRFSTRLDYRIDAEIVEAARRPDIQRLLGEVVSKERVGEEVRKMLGGPRPLQSVCALVQEFRIYHCLFAPHNHFGSIDTTTMTMTKEKNTVEAADGSSVELDYSTVVPLARALETLALQWPHIGEFLPPGVTDFPTEAQRQLFMGMLEVQVCMPLPHRTVKPLFPTTHI